LPTTLADLRRERVSAEELLNVGEIAMVPASVIHSVPVNLSPQLIADCIWTASQVAEQRPLNKQQLPSRIAKHSLSFCQRCADRLLHNSLIGVYLRNYAVAGHITEAKSSIQLLTQMTVWLFGMSPRRSTIQRVRFLNPSMI